MARYLALLLFILSFATSVLAQTADPDFNFTYTLLPKGNQSFILPDGTINFPDATVNVANPTLSQTNSATFVATNHTNRAITVSNVTLSGAGFNLSGLPLLPVVL